jgi:hypothetical protein
VIDDEIDRHERLDQLRIFLQLLHRVAHRGEIDQERDAGEILQDDARDDEGNFVGDGRLRVPVGQRADVVFADPFSVEITQHRLEHDADADRQFRDRPHAGFFQRGQRIVCNFLTRLGGCGTEGVEKRVKCHILGVINMAWIKHASSRNRPKWVTSAENYASFALGRSGRPNFLSHEVGIL